MLSNKVREIMTKELLTAEASSTVYGAMKMMAARNVGRVLVIDQGAPAGIFTEHDVVSRIMNKRLDPKKRTLREVMTTPLLTVGEETRIVEALGRMYRKNFRHLLVRGEKGAIVGIVSMRRILKAALELGEDLTETLPVKRIMSRHCHTVDGSQSIHEAIKLMSEANAGCVAVLSEGKPKGIFTERDVLRRVAVKHIDTRRTPIKKVMTTAVVTMPYWTPVPEVLGEMYHKGFRHMPIPGNQGGLVGTVCMRNVFRYAGALDVDTKVRKTWKEIEEFWQSLDQYTPG